jgi:hypothetical protein
MKQTSTEWLFEQLWENPKDKLTWYAILYIAKELEKEQMIEFSEQVFRNRYNEVYQSLTKVSTDTYNETFKD